MAYQYQQFWCLRQNPYANTNQIQMREFIISQKIVTCPFGHLSDERNNVIDGNYNEEISNSQDRKCIENINIGDIIIIPFAGIKECILARVTSEPIYGVHTGMFTIKNNNMIQLSNNEGTPFRPVARKIEIINMNRLFNDKRVLPRMSLSHVNPNILQSN
jgi:hypothetical protein